MGFDLGKFYEDETVDVSPMFDLRRQRSLLDDADDHVSYVKEDILKELEQSQRDLDLMLLSEQSRDYIKIYESPQQP